MPVSQINGIQNDSGSNVSSLTYSFTTSAGNNTILIVAASHRDSRNSGSVVSGVTFGGTPLTQVKQSTQTAFRDVYTSIWYLLNPSVTTANIVVTYNNTVDVAKSTAALFEFVNPDNPFRGDNEAGGFGVNARVFIDAEINDLIIDSIASFSNTTWTPSAANGQTYVDDFTSTTEQLYTGFSKKDGSSSQDAVRWTRTGTIGREWALVVGALEFESSSSSSSSTSSSSSSSSVSSSSSSSTSNTPSIPVWGHQTGIEEDVSRTFLNNWTTSAGWSPSGSGDDEILQIAGGDCGQITVSERWYLGAFEATIFVDKYQTGSGPYVLQYKTATTGAGLSSASWTTYNGTSFTSLGWVKLRLIHS